MPFSVAMFVYQRVILLLQSPANPVLVGFAATTHVFDFQYCSTHFPIVFKQSCTTLEDTKKLTQNGKNKKQHPQHDLSNNRYVFCPRQCVLHPVWYGRSLECCRRMMTPRRWWLWTVSSPWSLLQHISNRMLMVLLHWL